MKDEIKEALRKGNLSKAFQEYVNTYNDVIFVFEKEIHSLMTSEFYNSGCIIDSINSLAYHKKREDCYMFFEHTDMPQKTWMELQGQGIVINFYHTVKKRKKSIKLYYDCILEKWHIDANIEFRYELCDIWETSFITVLNKLTEFVNQKHKFPYIECTITESMEKIFQAHKTIIELNK